MVTNVNIFSLPGSLAEYSKIMGEINQRQNIRYPGKIGQISDQSFILP